MFKISYLFVILLIIFHSSSSVTTSSPPERAVVVGYLPEWRYLQWTTEEQQYRWHALSEHMTHLIIFSLEISEDGELAAMDRFPTPVAMTYAHRAAAQYDTKLMICFGGNSRTNGFPQMVATPQTRAHFLNNLVDLFKTHGFVGVDYNWEYVYLNQNTLLIYTYQ